MTRDLAWAQMVVQGWRNRSQGYVSWEETKENVAAVLKHCGGRTEEATACILAYKEEVRQLTHEEDQS
jgi:hypothetical protein